ncbi:hypothetical protein SADUNF_Sadunf19G0030900 [Salix dunnii]|uniref:EF-hand domain-containing protein n=1 Tax=Salix dunnii TaxID=1413687 RepID=A0A835J1Q1_9ROSI|nr:hypothetical protein SADUNF_Sadunf19G0030900 [Salix dunnii]
MEELRRAARASYERLPEKDKKFIQKFFKDMDKNGDGHISLGEYVKYLEKKKATDLTHKSIFSALDMDGNGSLEIKEVIVLHYIMQSGRAMICMSCENLMAGAYFSCSQCFFEDASVSTFDICCDCYGGSVHPLVSSPHGPGAPSSPASVFASNPSSVDISSLAAASSSFALVGLQLMIDLSSYQLP